MYVKIDTLFFYSFYLYGSESIYIYELTITNKGLPFLYILLLAY